MVDSKQMTGSAAPKSAPQTPASTANRGASPQFTLGLSIYVASVSAAGLGLVAARLPLLHFDQPLLFLALLIGSIAISASKVHLPIARGGATLSMSYFTDFLALVLLGPDQAMLIAGAGGATQCLFDIRGRRSLRQTLFSVSALILTMQAAGYAASLFGGFPAAGNIEELARPAVAAAATFFFCNSWLVAVAVGLSRKRSIFRTWQQDFLWTAPACFIGAGVALLSVRVLFTMPVWVVMLVSAPLYLTYRSYRIYLGRIEDHQRHLQEVSDLHLASVEALARAIDARDQTIDRAMSPHDNHIRRVQAMAAALGRTAGMSEGEVEGVKVAALLHDIGKLAVPEHILTKPGRLTPDEFEKVRIHPTIGAEIIRAVPFPYPVAPYIQSHHERWDGSGYPDGVSGDRIPLGARILAVVDYYDALTTDRPYRRAITREAAFDVLRAEAGRALDPALVVMFIELLPGLDLSHAGESLDVTGLAGGRLSAPAAGFSSECTSTATASNVFQNISRATQEMHALYDIAQTLGTRLSVDDTMALLTAKLNRLVPASAWTLYLYDADARALECRYASGLGADALNGLRVPSGEGATGWAARHRSAAVNVRGAADFEAGGRREAGQVFESALSYPLVDGDVLVGAITTYHVEREAYRDEHRRLLDRVGSQVASVIRNSVLFEQMQQVSFTDSLTDLPNSRALFAFLHEQFTALPVRTASSALMMIDLDGFKAINDEYGHQAGDQTLRQVASAIRRHVRQSDFCARYAGDEFVVVLPICGREDAEDRARRIQAGIDGLVIEPAPGMVLKPSVSIGVAVSPEDGSSYDELLVAADRRMYEDKVARRGGRRGGTPPPPPSRPALRLAHSA